MCCLSYCSSSIMSIRADTPASSVLCHPPLCVPHGPLSGGRTDGCAVCSTGRNVSSGLRSCIGHRLRAASVHDVRNHRLYSFGCLFYPSARVMSERTDMRKFLEWLEYPGALADSYHSIITQDCHDNADNGSPYNPHDMNHQKQNENEK